MSTKPINIKSLETGTGHKWEYWLEYLETINAKELPHNEIARKLKEQGLNDWWCQEVTVAYEQQIGRRQPGQTCKGDYQIAVSKTIGGNMDEVLEKWVVSVKNYIAFDGVNISNKGVSNKSEKWRYWRCSLEDFSSISVNIQTKSSGNKSTLTINHNKIQSREKAECWKIFWKTFDV